MNYKILQTLNYLNHRQKKIIGRPMSFTRNIINIFFFMKKKNPKKKTW